MNNKGFTLIELLVVIVIIGILAAIALPKYQKALLRSRFTQGYVLVDTLYRAQESFFLANDRFAEDIDELDVSIPKSSSCTKTQGTSSFYVCPFGRVGLSEDGSYVEYIYRPNGVNQMSYVHVLKDWSSSSYHLNYHAGERYCYASSTNNTKATKALCESLGGEELSGTNNVYWYYYKLPNNT